MSRNNLEIYNNRSKVMEDKIVENFQEIFNIIGNDLSFKSKLETYKNLLLKELIEFPVEEYSIEDIESFSIKNRISFEKACQKTISAAHPVECSTELLAAVRETCSPYSNQPHKHNPLKKFEKVSERHKPASKAATVAHNIVATLLSIIVVPLVAVITTPWLLPRCMNIQLAVFIAIAFFIPKSSSNAYCKAVSAAKKSARDIDAKLNSTLLTQTVFAQQQREEERQILLPSTRKF